MADSQSFYRLISALRLSNDANNYKLADQLLRTAQTNTLQTLENELETSRTSLENLLPPNVSWQGLMESAREHWNDVGPTTPQEAQKPEEGLGFEDFLGQGLGRGQSAGEQAMMHERNDLEKALDLEQQEQLLEGLHARSIGETLYDDRGELTETGVQFATGFSEDDILNGQRNILEDRLYEQAMVAEKEGKAEDAAKIREHIQQRRKDDEIRRNEDAKLKEKEKPSDKAKREQQEAKDKTELESYFRQQYNRYRQETVQDPKNPRNRRPKYTFQQAYDLAFNDALRRRQSKIPTARRRRFLGSRMDRKYLEKLDKGLQNILGRLPSQVNPQLRREAEKKKKEEEEKKREAKEEEDDSTHATPGTYGQDITARSTEKTTQTTRTSSESSSQQMQANVSAKTGGRGNVRRIKNLVDKAQKVAEIVAAAPDWLPVALIVIGVIFLIVIIAVIVFYFINAPVFSPIQLACGDKAPPDAQGISHQLNVLYHINFDDKEKGATSLGASTATTVDSQVFNAVCILFGHDVGSLHIGKNEFNTFGTLTVGTPQQRNVDKSALAIHFVLQNDSSKPLCYMQYPFKSNATDLVWTFYNPSDCSSQYQLQFRVAQALGYTLIAQQEHIRGAGKFSLFSQDFINGPLATGRLPTFRCNSPAWSSASEQSKDCFADMVGEYLTYPFYVDTGFANAGATIPPTPVTLTDCKGNTATTLAGINLIKEFLPPGHGTNGKCVIPNYIVMHTTNYYYDSTAQALYNDFFTDPQGRGVGTNFGIGQKGDIIQMEETYTNKVTMSYSVYGWFDVISIELVEGGKNYDGCPGMPGNVPPQAQYNAALNLVTTLMKQYDIPMGNDTSWQSASGLPNDNPPPRGVYGHFQLNTSAQGNPGDPGKNFLTCFRNDLQRKLGL